MSDRMGRDRGRKNAYKCRCDRCINFDRMAIVDRINKREVREFKDLTKEQEDTYKFIARKENNMDAAALRAQKFGDNNG